MKDAAGEILYVGKAKSLKSRVRSYFARSAGHSLKTRELVRRVADFETLVVDTEAEALILENNLIKEHSPRFNINLKDDKTYPYIKVSVQEEFPRVYVTRRLIRDGARYFGPYTDVRRMRQALDLIKKLYTIRSCHYDLPRDVPARPCLDFHIGRCKAPCVGSQTGEDYRGMVDEILDILSGHTRRAGSRIREAMNEAAREMDFERAAELRDALNQLERLEARQKMVDVSGSDRDVVGLARDGDTGCGVVLRIREGKLLGREAQFLSNLDDETDESVIGAFVTRFYAARAGGDEHDLASEVFLPADFQDRAALQEFLATLAGRPVRMHVPQRGDKLSLVELASQNARHLLEEWKLVGNAAQGRAPDALYELQAVLELGHVPRFIVCFDVSHTQGSETVASAVALTNGEPDKSQYRKFRVKGEWGNDDFRSMQEVVHRYFARRMQEGEPLPDLILIDGGKGQLSAARAALEQLDLGHQSIASLAKRDEEVFLPGRRDPIRLPRRSAALRLLQRVRDEAHRFAVSYNRQLRSKRTIRSELGSISGIGPARQRALLERFGSLQAVRRATEDQIAAVPGIGPALARTVLRQLQHGAPPPTRTVSA